VGKKLAQGKVEVFNRRSRETVEIDTAEAPAHVASAVRGAVAGESG